MHTLPQKQKNEIIVFSSLGLAYSFICIWLLFFAKSYADVSLNAFLVVILLAHISWFLALFLVYKKKVTIRAIFFWAVIFRLILLFAYPVLENDILRYMWDGYLIDRFGSAYGVFPSSFYLDDTISSIMQPILDIISAPDVATVYGPLLEFVFYLAYKISPGEVWPIKLFVVSADITILWLLSSRLSSMKFLLYAWSPLILLQFSLNAHAGIIAVCLLLLACYFVFSKRWYLPPIFLALAISGKIFAVLAIPFLLKHRRQFITLLILLTIIYMPVIISGQSELSGLTNMLYFGHFNSLLYGFGYYLLSIPVLKLISLLVFLSAYGYIFYFYHKKDKILSIEQALTYVYFIFLLCLPVVNIWYLSWILGFAAYTRLCWPWAFSVLIWLAIFTGINLKNSNLGLYEIPGFILLIEYALLSLFIVGEIKYRKNKEYLMK